MSAGSRIRRVLVGVAVAGAVTAVAVPAGAADQQSATPGTIGGSAVRAADDPAGLGVIVDERGRISQSIDAAGTLSGSTSVTVDKPAGATVRRAVLLAATTGGSGPLTSQISLNGTVVALGNETASAIESDNYWTDVTALVKPTVDAAAAGQSELPVTESDPSNVDGVVLAVIFDDPAQPRDRSVTLLFGATQTVGDHFRLQLSMPFDPNALGAQLDMSLGISFSFQTGGSQQFSQVDVNGSRLTTSAGGEDDGEPQNGGLVTVGGVGDSTADPDPLATPTQPRSDDELYDLKPFVASGSSQVDVNTLNPSNDDNIFFAAFTSNPPVTRVITPNPPPDQDLVALGDSYSSGEGTRNYDATPAGQACHRGPDAWPRVLERRAEAIVSIDHRACTGATVPDLALRFRNTGPEIPATPNLDADLVTLTVGGSDAGLAAVLSDCFKPQTTCATDPDSPAFRSKLTTLGRNLDVLYRKLQRAYPNAQLVHVGYPQVTPSADVTPVGCSWLSPAEQMAAPRAVQLVDGVIQAAAARSGLVTYVDVTSALQGHELCTGDPWVVPISSTLNTEIGHPTAPGQNAIAAAVATQLGFPLLP
jgi:lysophospholipase L1-like esterase